MFELKAAGALIEREAYVDATYDNNPSKDNTPFLDTPLLIAIENGNDDVAALLVENGAKVNLPNQLYKVVLWGHDHYGRETFRGVYYTNMTPLMLATRNGNLPLMKFLKEKGADLNLKTEMQGMPLFQAISTRNAEAAQLLLELGASLPESAFGFLDKQIEQIEYGPDRARRDTTSASYFRNEINYANKRINEYEPMLKDESLLNASFQREGRSYGKRTIESYIKLVQEFIKDSKKQVSKLTPGLEACQNKLDELDKVGKVMQRQEKRQKEACHGELAGFRKKLGMPDPVNSM